MLKPSDFGLKNNPFHPLATDGGTEHWAGMPQAKEMLGDVIHSVLPNDIGAMEFVVLHGHWGSGKTHALRYFAREIREQKYGHAFFAGKIRISDKLSFAELFNSILGECDDAFFKELARQVSASLTRRVADVDPERRQGGESVVIEREVPSGNRELVRQLRQYADQEKDVKPFLKAKDDYDAVVKMASLVRVMTSSIGGEPPPHQAAYLFLDEAEDALEAPPKQIVSFMSACRELVNRVEENFAFILVFSEESAYLESAIPPAVARRLTRRYIELEPMSDEDARAFVSKFLEFVRLEEFNPPQEFYPFTKEAVDAILARITRLVPGDIIMGMRKVFERAVRRERVGPGEEISRKVAEEVLNEMGV